MEFFERFCSSHVHFKKFILLLLLFKMIIDCSIQNYIPDNWFPFDKWDYIIIHLYPQEWLMLWNFNVETFTCDLMDVRVHSKKPKRYRYVVSNQTDSIKYDLFTFLEGIQIRD